MNIEDLRKEMMKDFITCNGITFETRKLNGNWDKGFSLDLHSVGSIPAGKYDNGRDRWDTYRTQIGEMVYQLKYQGDLSQIDTLAESSVAAIKKLILKETNLDCIIPVPSSNTSRSKQPVFKVAEKVAEILGIPIDINLLEKTSNTDQMKNVEVKDRSSKLEDVFTVSKPDFSYSNILLFDDIFDSGTTASECVKALKSEKINIKIFLLTLTKTRRS